MKAADLRDKSVDDLRSLATEKREELFRLRMQLYTNQLDKPHRIRETRRDIARIETLISQR